MQIVSVPLINGREVAISTHDLKAMRDLLASEERWCKTSIALDGAGNLRSPLSPNARKFCLLGAGAKVLHLPVYVEILGKLHSDYELFDALNVALVRALRLEEEWGNGNVAIHNDTSNHARILTTLDIALDHAENPDEEEEA